MTLTRAISEEGEGESWTPVVSGGHERAANNALEGAVEITSSKLGNFIVNVLFMKIIK